MRKSIAIKAGLILSSSTIGQLITIACIPIITKLYGPEEIGRLGVYISIISIVAPIATMGMPQAIPVVKKQYHCGMLAQITLVFTCIVLFLGCTAFAVYTYVGDVSNSILSSFELSMAVLGITAMSIWSIYNNWSIRIDDVKRRIYCNISVSIFLNLTKIVLFYIKIVQGGLILAQTLSYIVAISIMGYKSTLLLLFKNRKKRLTLRYLLLIKRHKDFILSKTPQTLVYYLNQSIVTIAIAKLFDLQSAGFYSFANSAMLLPAGILGKTINELLIGFFSKEKQLANHGAQPIEKVSIYLFFSASLIFIPYVLFLPNLIDFFMGNQWSGVKPFIQALLMVTILDISLKPYMTKLQFSRGQHLHLASELMLLILNIILIFFVSVNGLLSSVEYVLLNSFATVFSGFVLFFLARWHIDTYGNKS